jgi:Got1/Sft2-like family
MANLKDDLDSYLIGEKKTSSFKLNMKMPKLPSMLGGSSTESSSSNNWLQEEKEGWCPKMSRIQRMIACVVCLGLGVFCMIVSTFYIPVLVFKARKFSLLFSMGSLLLIAG